MTLSQRSGETWPPERFEQTRRELRWQAAAAQPDWSGRRIALGIALWLVGAALLAALSVAAQRSPEFPGDLGIAQSIQRLSNPAVKSFVNFASDANWPTPAGIVAAVVIVGLALLRHVRAAVCALLASFGADGLNVTLNRLVARPRPNNVQIHTVAHLGLHSFPSGHVTHVIAFYGLLFYLSRKAWTRLSNPAYVEGRQASRHWLDRAQAHPAWRALLVVVQAICAYFIVFIGPSRVLEGEHWPSDVVASYLLGGLVLLAVIGLYHALGVWWVERRRGHAAHPSKAGADSRYEESGTA